MFQEINEVLKQIWPPKSGSTKFGSQRIKQIVGFLGTFTEWVCIVTLGEGIWIAASIQFFGSSNSSPSLFTYYYAEQLKGLLFLRTHTKKY